MIIIIDDARCVAGLLQAPKNARICYVLAHGAGTGMSHPFMVAVADGLAERGIATLRYGSARVQPSSCFPMPIIPFTCRRAAGVKTRRSEPSYWIR